MIKSLIFDLDGVLCSTKEIHFLALNAAILAVSSDEYVISIDDHYNRFDGLSTDTKLKLLSTERDLPNDLHKQIKLLKQCNTIDLINKTIKPNYELQQDIANLSNKYELYCASNAIANTVNACLERLGIRSYFKRVYSNQSIKYPKPHPEIYLKCMSDNHLHPKETLIIEDSINGKQAAIDSGAHVYAVYSPNDVTELNIERQVSLLKGEKMKWKDSKLNVLIPMAGLGSRFAAAGYTFPKPLIDVRGKPMIQRVVENLNIDAHYIYIIQQEHDEKYNLYNFLNLLTPDCEVYFVDRVTEGALCSVLLATDSINTDNPLLLANSDQLVEWDSSKFMYHMINRDVDGGILTFNSIHPKWSFAKVENGRVVQVAEKNPISDCATVGIYYYKSGSDFVKYAEQMIAENIRVNNEFYVCPVFNEYIEDGKDIQTYNIEKMWGLGTPEDLDFFLKEHND